MKRANGGQVMGCLVGVAWFFGVLFVLGFLITYAPICLYIVLAIVLLIILVVIYGQIKAGTQSEAVVKESKAIEIDKSTEEERIAFGQLEGIVTDKKRKKFAVKDKKISKLDKFLLANSDTIDKFFEIAYRKVSVIDEYGDEDWGILKEEIFRCLFKIVEKSQKGLSWSSFRKSPYFYFNGRYCLDIADMMEVLEKKFKTYYKDKKRRNGKDINIEGLSGVEFETFVSNVLKNDGYSDVSGTPATGDQGADIIAKKDGKTIIIQAKRWEGTVGNKAVQEVIGAVRFYGGDVGWVVTNSLFTSSAKALAQKANIRLVDGNDLKEWVNKTG